MTTLWVYLSATPLFWLTVTLVAWLAALGTARLLGRHPMANPVLIAVVLVGGLLAATRTQYPTYFNGAQFVHFLLGPATVALGVPLCKNLGLLRRNLAPMLAALVVGAVVAVASAVMVAAAFGAPRAILVSLAPSR